MPRADEYAGAATWCEDELAAMKATTFEPADDADAVASATLAARCVRAMAAWKAGEVVVHAPQNGGDLWLAFTPTHGRMHYAPDPLDAITAALGGDDAPR